MMTKSKIFRNSIITFDIANYCVFHQLDKALFLAYI